MTILIRSVLQFPTIIYLKTSRFAYNDEGRIYFTVIEILIGARFS